MVRGPFLFFNIPLAPVTAQTIFGIYCRSQLKIDRKSSKHAPPNQGRPQNLKKMTHDGFRTSPIGHLKNLKFSTPHLRGQTEKENWFTLKPRGCSRKILMPSICDVTHLYLRTPPTHPAPHFVDWSVELPSKLECLVLAY